MSTTPDDAPFDRLSNAQTLALCNVAFGGEGMTCNKRTLAGLAAKGLIEPVEEAHGDRFGVFAVQKWIMPIHVHVAFCEWCAESVADEVS